MRPGSRNAVQAPSGAAKSASHTEAPNNTLEVTHSRVVSGRNERMAPATRPQRDSLLNSGNLKRFNLAHYAESTSPTKSSVAERWEMLNAIFGKGFAQGGSDAWAAPSGSQNDGTDDISTCIGQSAGIAPSSWSSKWSITDQEADLDEAVIQAHLSLAATDVSSANVLSGLPTLDPYINDGHCMIRNECTTAAAADDESRGPGLSRPSRLNADELLNLGSGPVDLDQDAVKVAMDLFFPAGTRNQGLEAMDLFFPIGPSNQAAGAPLSADSSGASLLFPGYPQYGNALPDDYQPVSRTDYPQYGTSVSDDYQPPVSRTDYPQYGNSLPEDYQPTVSRTDYPQYGNSLPDDYQPPVSRALISSRAGGVSPLLQSGGDSASVPIQQNLRGTLALPIPMPAPFYATELTVAQLASIPRDKDGRYLSIGSKAHASGQCKPCVFFRNERKRGCFNGPCCTFCHYDHPPRKKLSRPSKRQRVMMRVLKKNAEDAKIFMQQQQQQQQQQPQTSPIEGLTESHQKLVDEEVLEK